jgi:hypothetical protein
LLIREALTIATLKISMRTEKLHDACRSPRGWWRFDFGEDFSDEAREAVCLRIFARTWRKSWMNQVKGAVPKVQVQSLNEWLACKCMKLVPQITGCKRCLCTCSHLEYSLDSRAISECKSPFVTL